MLKIIPYSLYAGNQVAAYLTRQHQRGFAFVGACRHFAWFRRAAPAEQTYAIAYLKKPFTERRCFIQGGLTRHIKVVSGGEALNERQPTEEMRQHLKHNAIFCGILLFALLVFGAVLYGRAIGESVSALRNWSTLTGFVLIPGTLMLLVCMTNFLADLRLIRKSRSHGRKFLHWLIMTAAVLLFAGQPVLNKALCHRIPEEVSPVYAAVSETWQGRLLSYNNVNLLERTDFMVNGSSAQGSFQLVYHNTPLQDAYLSAWRQECSGGASIDPGNGAISFETAPGHYSAAFPGDGGLYILYVSGMEEVGFLSIVSSICDALP